MSADQLIDRYIKLRDRVAELKKQHEAEVSPLKEAMERIERHFLSELNEKGANSFGTPTGVVFKSTVNSATVADKELFREYLIRTGEWGLADLRAAKTAVKEYVETKEDLPPGINWRSETVVRINRP